MALDYGAKRYKLAGVKECLFHPKLPTLRRIDMDTTAHKLPDEHCRTTTPCTRENFRNMSVVTGLRIHKPFKQVNLNRKWYYRNYYSFRGDTNRTKDEDTVDDIEKPALVANKNVSLPLQSLGTEKKQWNFLLQQEPYIDHIGQRPIPATIFSRYRSNSSLNGGQISSRAWRP